MQTFRISASVAGFLLLGGLAFIYLFSVLGETHFQWGQQYTLQADFINASGLEPGSVIEIAGVEVGRVDSIQRINDRARVTLSVGDGIEVPEDTIASIKTRGLLGGLYMVLSLGGSDRILGPGGKIRDTESPVDIPGLMAAYVAFQKKATQAEAQQ
jgi:phospholipid/cholesterol/gamma-HCH transport system substrate-binding protein